MLHLISRSNLPLVRQPIRLHGRGRGRGRDRGRGRGRGRGRVGIGVEVGVREGINIL